MQGVAATASRRTKVTEEIEEPSQQAVTNSRGAIGRSRSSSWQGPTEGHGCRSASCRDRHNQIELLQRLTVRVRRRPPFRWRSRVRSASPLVGELAGSYGDRHSSFRPERRRRWASSEKARIVEESLRPGAVVTVVRGATMCIRTCFIIGAVRRSERAGGGRIEVPAGCGDAGRCSRAAARSRSSSPAACGCGSMRRSMRRRWAGCCGRWADDRVAVRRRGCGWRAVRPTCVAASTAWRCWCRRC